MIIDRFDGTYAFLSNFYPSPVVYEGIEYPTVENAFQAAKTLSRDVRLTFVYIPPGRAKLQGKRIELRQDWEEVKLSIMHNLLKLKFNEGFLKAQLLATGDATLIEGNDWNDTFWGVCNEVGTNHLGKLLERVRNEYSA